MTRFSHSLMVASLLFVGAPAFSETDTVSISGGWAIHKEDNPLFARDSDVSPFTCVAQAVSARGQVLRIRVFPVSYQVNVELPYLYYPIKTLPDTVYFDTDNARLFSASTLPGLEQAYAQLYDGSGYALFLALQSEGRFEVSFSGGALGIVG